MNDGLEAAVLVVGIVKLAVNETLRYLGNPRRWRGVRGLVARLYLLLEDFLDQLDHIVIDDDLPGWEVENRRQLLALILQQFPKEGL